MSSPALRVENLSKVYQIGARENGAQSFREALVGLAAAPLRRLRQLSGQAGGAEQIWALKEVSFEVQPGEVVGIIGRNGAGKSTLLKILSRITEPTAGFADIRGRVGSLLEVGTGFHSELTGRENVYLNGAILGMKRVEIDRKFDEIVAFAEVEKFLDTPVKYYSSGMYMRLAFAVAAHLEPEILLVDEVLAVGDAAFQRKCLGKMDALVRGGRTILFVSHNLAAIRSLCSQCLLVQDGRLSFVGQVEDCLDRYLRAHLSAELAAVGTDEMPRPQNHDNLGKELKITRVQLRDPTGRAVVRTGDPLKISLRFRLTEPVREVTWGFSVETPDSLRLLEFSSAAGLGPVDLSPGLYESTGSLDSCPLKPGLYKIVVGARAPHKGLDWLPEAMYFRVEESTRYESLWLEYNNGLVRLPCQWTRPVEQESGGEVVRW